MAMWRLAPGPCAVIVPPVADACVTQLSHAVGFGQFVLLSWYRGLSVCRGASTRQDQYPIEGGFETCRDVEDVSTVLLYVCMVELCALMP